MEAVAVIRVGESSVDRRDANGVQMIELTIQRYGTSYLVAVDAALSRKYSLPSLADPLMDVRPLNWYERLPVTVLLTRRT